jgi:putative tryptophan/tyrosine transport system substrate-binding protein
MPRRLIVLLVTCVLGCWLVLLAAAAPQAGKKPRIGVLSVYDRSSAAALHPAPFLQGLDELGWAEGQNLEVESRYAEGHPERLPALAAELVRLPVDVILALGPLEAWAAKQATTTIPIVFNSVGNPVGVGLVASLAHSGGNVTGLSSSSADLSGKRLELLKEAAPRITRVAVLTDRHVAYLITELEHAVHALGGTLSPFEVRAPHELAPAFAAMMTTHADALIVLSAPLFFGQRRRIVDLAAQRGLPATYPFRGYVVAGGLMSYGPNNADLDRRAATYVDKILRGAKPADLPVEQPTKFELVINLKTAQALGLTIPPMLLFEADEVIQ